MGLEDLYQQIILDHYRKPRHRGELEHPSVEVDHNNPVCGDQLHLGVLLEDGRIAGVAHTGDGCSISQASASMMSEAVAGMPVDDALELVEHFRLMMHRQTEPDEDRLGDAIALEGVAKYPVRVKCALLSWMALKDALQTHSATTER
ncbi:MAG: SUF system NifU family Fe-S cluster assembly protein [Thermoleophilia bacterium]|nr:SUF system NifU family Fe-S cluster assembly protein [Thermoleophilia bacterium]